ncbi:DUF2281 domain-containing protein [Spirulina sp. CCNP1310]|uniref:DUF2281 domain-containing protein n=1 Tax=Spirulina sp. CCNP1310 TaxID=3110249 RepID=UPI002B1FCD1B|nr:DUF2281 domain-containing protein [Spirulina sp. CCNP1310]MEA5419323.1 DUF2281 domain-containing protein [Spirulina sp. CCNP1310]
MIVLTGVYSNGNITLTEPLPQDLEGKQIQIIIQELPRSQKRRQSGSAKGKIWMAADFDAPLDDFQSYTS